MDVDHIGIADCRMKLLLLLLCHFFDIGIIQIIVNYFIVLIQSNVNICTKNQCKTLLFPNKY